MRGLWGGDNRTVPLRIPGGDESSARIEHRVAGADANPYLVVAAVLAGIHHGITNKIAPQEPVVGDGYAQDGGVPLPIRWPLATLARSWVRPNDANTCADIDCTPRLTRLTPAAR